MSISHLVLGTHCVLPNLVTLYLTSIFIKQNAAKLAAVIDRDKYGVAGLSGSAPSIRLAMLA